MYDSGSRSNDDDRENPGYSDPFEDEEGSDFDGTTSRTGWNRVTSTAKRIVSRTIETAEGVAHRSRSEVEIAQLKIKLRSTYARLGELLFRLKEGEESSKPFDDQEVQVVFQQIRTLLGDIESERQQVRNMKRQDFQGA